MFEALGVLEEYRKHLAGEEGGNGEDPIVRLNRRMTAELAAPEGERHPADLWIQKVHPWEVANKGAQALDRLDHALAGTSGIQGLVLSNPLAGGAVRVLENILAGRKGGER